MPEACPERAGPAPYPAAQRALFMIAVNSGVTGRYSPIPGTGNGAQ
jgi:hypothetical protein